MSHDLTLQAIAGFRLVTANPSRLAAFYRAIGFDVGEAAPIPAADMDRLGLRGAGSRIAMALGPSRAHIEVFEQPGQPYPAKATACDLIFQHFALVTDDAGAAWRQAQNAGAMPIGRDRPSKLPESDGSVTALKFRDPDGHPLEFLQFPPGGNSDWKGAGVMGIDHSAISVSNVAASRRFYESHGLSAGHATFNHGPAQAALDGLDGVEVDIAPMNPARRTPHLELLAYRRPIGRPFQPLAANDIAATRIVWRSTADALIRDPDGHIHELSIQDR